MKNSYFANTAIPTSFLIQHHFFLSCTLNYLRSTTFVTTCIREMNCNSFRNCRTRNFSTTSFFVNEICFPLNSQSRKLCFHPGLNKIKCFFTITSQINTRIKVKPYIIHYNIKHLFLALNIFDKYSINKKILGNKINNLFWILTLALFFILLTFSKNIKRIRDDKTQIIRVYVLLL